MPNKLLLPYSSPPPPHPPKHSLRKVCSMFIGQHSSVRSTANIEVSQRRGEGKVYFFFLFRIFWYYT